MKSFVPHIIFVLLSFVSFLASWSDQHLFCLFWNTLYKQGIKWPSKEELFESRKGKEDRQKQLPSLSSLLKHVLRRIADFSSCIQNIFLRAAHTNTHYMLLQNLPERLLSG